MQAAARRRRRQICEICGRKKLAKAKLINFNVEGDFVDKNLCIFADEINQSRNINQKILKL
jgi:hypothetical protein